MRAPRVNRNYTFVPSNFICKQQGGCVDRANLNRKHRERANPRIIEAEIPKRVVK